MLLISSDAIVKIGKHAWNVYPLEAFGYLLGRRAENRVHAALPCSKTTRWYEYGDRWNGIGEYLDQASAVAAQFDMEVIGFYASQYPVDASDPGDPVQAVQGRDLVLVYTANCHSCSSILLRIGEHRFHGDEFEITQGRRIVVAVNQKQILKAWRRLHGDIDYSNGYIRSDSP